MGAGNFADAVKHLLVSAMRKTVVSIHPLSTAAFRRGMKAKVHTLSRALICTAAFGLLTMWSYGQSPAYQNCEFADDLKGYSVEHADPQSPGGGYVMAGTLLISTKDIVHFVSTDPAGAIQAAHIFRGNGLDLKAVDIVPGDNSNGTYFITAQVRDAPTGTSGRAYLRVYEVAFNGTPINIWDVRPQPGQAPFQTDLFASHSVLRNGLLYICGWSEIVGSYPYSPTANGGNKRGMIIRLDINNNAAFVDGRSWNTVPMSPSTSDFDMALKMRLDPDQDRLLVTGAANGSNNLMNTPSNVMVAALDMATLNPAWRRKFTRTSAPIGEGPIWDGRVVWPVGRNLCDV